MAEEDKNQPNQPKQPDPQEALNAIRASIANAFNLGLQTQPKQPTDTIVEVIKEIQEVIYGQLKQAYGDEVPEEFIKANAEFFIQVAAAGFIIPRICSPDKDFQAKLFQLVEDRVLETQRKAAGMSQEDDKKIIREEKKIIV